jgi:hypothetical protein
MGTLPIDGWETTANMEDRLNRYRAATAVHLLEALRYAGRRPHYLERQSKDYDLARSLSATGRILALTASPPVQTPARSTRGGVCRRAIGGDASARAIVLSGHQRQRRELRAEIAAREPALRRFTQAAVDASFAAATIGVG